tara:strand:- start:72 stop:563 length:492 start_codon:yes stop_codon:yes gene_type:complete
MEPKPMNTNDNKVDAAKEAYWEAHDELEHAALCMHSDKELDLLVQKERNAWRALEAAKEGLEKSEPMKTIEDLVQYFADHGEVIHTEGECVHAVDYYIECAFDDKEEFIRLFIGDATSEQLFMIRKIIGKSFSASDALDKFQFYFEEELREMLHEALIHQAND